MPTSVPFGNVFTNATRPKRWQLPSSKSDRDFIETASLFHELFWINETVFNPSAIQQQADVYVAQLGLLL